MVTNGLKKSLQEADNIVVTAIYNTAHDLINNLQQLDADVLILDMHLPDASGHNIAAAVLKQKPSLRILVFSSTDSIFQVKRMQQAGCLGYLLKNADSNTLVKAIGAVYEGYRFLSPELEKALIEDMFAGKASNKPKKVALTVREQEILQLIVKEYTNQEIAARLFLTLSTIEFHRTNMLQKMGVKNTAGLVREAVMAGLV